MPDSLGLLFMLLVLAITITIVVTGRADQRWKALLTIGLLMRLGGAIVYYLAMLAYGGGDAEHYLLKGSDFAMRMWHGDFGMFTEPGVRFWGTKFIEMVSGVTTSLIGSSLVANGLLFSLGAFVGLYAFVSAFRRTYPEASARRYARWIWLLPSLWFWTSGVGKDAILILGLGLAVNGFVGTARKIHWASLITGVVCIFSVRPQVLAVVLFSMVFAQWVVRSGKWNLGRILQGAVFVAAAVVLIRVALRNVGIDDTAGINEYVQQHALHAARGNADVGVSNSGALAAPIAAFNILFRPLPWDVQGATAMMSMVEIVGFWFLAFYRRRDILNALRHWRTDRFLATCLVFVLLYSTILGLVIVNLGIIARQRTCLFPCLFVFFEAMPAPSRVKPGYRPVYVAS